MTIERLRPYIAFMKWRNRVLALICLAVFGGLGILYFQHWVVQKPFGIILFIGEGLTPARLAAARVYAGGADSRLSIDSMNHCALLRNYSNDFATPDQAAAATALATGQRVNNRSIAINANGKALTNIVELAHASGRVTGLVTNTKLTDPTCAAFYAHPTDPNNVDAIATELISGGKIDIAMGGGGAQFVTETAGGRRQDGRDLIAEGRQNGFTVVGTKAALEAIPGWQGSKVLGVFAPDELAFADEIERRGEQPNLADMVRRAIELLQYNRRGYVLIVDAGLMRVAARDNQAERTLNEIVELDRAVAVARRYAGQRSTIVVCGDVGIGGLTLNGFPFRTDSGIAVLGLNSAGEPWITWANGPKGVQSYGATKMATPELLEHSVPKDYEPAAYYAKWALNTVEDVVAFGTGPGTESLTGVEDNTLVFSLLRSEL